MRPRAMIELNKQALTPRLSDIDCRVDVVGGDSDVFCPRKAADIILGGLGNSHYHEITDAGHLLSVDQPEAYTRLLQKLITLE